MLDELITKYTDTFQDQPNATTVCTNTIEVTQESNYFRHTYRTPKAYQEQVDAEIREMVTNGLIERSESDFLTP